MRSQRKGSGALAEVATPVDLLYIGAILLAFGILFFIQDELLYLVYPVALFSLCLDWQSARVAHRRNSTVFLALDLITVLNYISLFVAMTLAASHPIRFSKLIWLNYGALFTIYIIWNAIMMSIRDTVAESRRFFFRFSMAAIPGSLSAILMFFEISTGYVRAVTGVDFLAYSNAVLLSLAAFHLLIMIVWIYITYLRASIKKAGN